MAETDPRYSAASSPTPTPALPQSVRTLILAQRTSAILLVLTHHLLVWSRCSRLSTWLHGSTRKRLQAEQKPTPASSTVISTRGAHAKHPSRTRTPTNEANVI